MSALPWSNWQRALDDRSPPPVLLSSGLGWFPVVVLTVGLLFPCLPEPSHSPKPLPASLDTEDVTILNDEVYATPEDLLHPLLMPELYPTLFNLYALYHVKDDDLYWLRLEKWYKKPDLAIMVYLGIESRYWRSDSMDFDAVDPDSPIWKFKGMNTFNNCYTQAVEMLQTISTAYSPMEKLIVLRQTFCEITKSLGEGELLGQDFLFPIFTFVILRAKIRQLGAEIHFIQDLMEPSLKTGELGHMITDLSVSLAAVYLYHENTFQLAAVT
ncbi:hypothetical protein LSH36_616g04036 [Paralvinella palmiformis]|uniref:VPS9 domain-containing protein n=1 Tax=Paralvinella palmiformis TaxID=53620 RepID=A0AAD9J4M4_9ANNE|nr:hypothetical protein LSH36_616g04036 [Paralvinella palmiformis]